MEQLTSLLLLLVLSCTQIWGKCPDGFIAIKGVCVTQFVDFSKEGSFPDASTFCGKFNPDGYKGELWKIDYTDLLASSFIALIGKQQEMQHGMQIWNGLQQIESISEQSSCAAVSLSDRAVIEIMSNCDRNLPFICALRQFEPECTDLVNSEVCSTDTNLFCDKTTVLRKLCRKTCGKCDEPEDPCDQRVDIWATEKCEKLAQQGHCERAVDNIRPVCSETCCNKDRAEETSASVLSTDCSVLIDSVECLENADLNQCFQDIQLTSNCIKSCCLMKHDSSLQPQKRKTHFKIQDEHHCQECHDMFPFSVCREKSACSAKKRKYCELTCCMRDEDVPITTQESTSLEATTSLPNECDEYENIYDDLVCQIIQSVQDCEETCFHKHCKKRCCVVGYDFGIGTTTVDPDIPCNEFIDGGDHCPSITSLDDCELKKYSDCEYTCCERAQTTTAEPRIGSGTTTEAGACDDKKDLIVKCSKVRNNYTC